MELWIIRGVLIMTKTHFDVLVVGGGMVGAAVATALGQQGVSVAVFDRVLPEPIQPTTLPELRVSALSFASEQILKNLGAWSFVENLRLCPYRKMAVWEKLESPWGQEIQSRANKTEFDAVKIGYPQLGFIVENRVVQLALMQTMNACDRVEVFSPVDIETMDFTSDQPEVILVDGRHFTGELLVGADGANSMVRQKAGLAIEQKDYEQQCLVATVEITGGRQDITWQAFTPTGPEAFLPLPDINGRSYASVVWYNLPESVQALLALPDAEFVEILEKTFPAELPGIKAVVERGAFPLARRHAQSYWRKGVVLVGDAAHTINPLAGQGVNLGFQDAAWLAEVLAEAQRQKKSPGNEEILMQYELCRRTDNRNMMSIMDGFYHTFSNNNKPLKFIRNIGLTLAGKNTPAIKQVMKYAMGLSGKQPKLAKGEWP